LPSLEDRIRKLEDRAALQDLVADYFKATDDDDYAALAAFFTADASFGASGFDGGGGREGIIAFLRTARAGMGQTVHTPNYVQLCFTDDDHASGVVGAHLELGMGDQTIYGAVRYLDTYARFEGRWQISSRDMKVIHIGPWADVGTSLSTPLNVRWPGAEPGPSDFPRKQI
jgi:SnoaL-like domain